MQKISRTFKSEGVGLDRVINSRNAPSFLFPIFNGAFISCRQAYVHQNPGPSERARPPRPETPRESPAQAPLKAGISLVTILHR